MFNIFTLRGQRETTVNNGFYDVHTRNTTRDLFVVEKKNINR